MFALKSKLDKQNEFRSTRKWLHESVASGDSRSRRLAGDGAGGWLDVMLDDESVLD